MKKAVRPFAARIPFEDKTRLAIAQTLDRREDLDLSWISRMVLNRNHAYLFQYLFKRTPRTLDYADAVKLAHFLKIDAGVFSPDTHPANFANYPSIFSINPLYARRAGKDSVPIRGPAKDLSPDAIQIDDGEDIGRAARHPAQKGMKGAFAFYTIGESMAPRYRPGELVYAVSNKPPVRGQDCVVELQNGAGYLREFERRAPRQRNFVQTASSAAQNGNDRLERMLKPSMPWWAGDEIVPILIV